MKQLKKTLLTLVALLAVTTGAWAQSALNVVELDVPAVWENDESNMTAADLPGFKASTLAEAQAWTGAPQTGVAYLIYAFDGEEVKYISFEKGKYSGDNSQPLPKKAFFGPSTVKFYYPTGSSSSAVTVTWDKDKNTGSFTMPAGNVTLEPDYYPQATLTAAPTAVNDVPATTDGAILKAGTVANIGETTTPQGTVMYYVSPTALDDAALLALAADKWTADLPTAESLAQGQAYVYYYVKGNDSDTDDENFSDGDIKAANKLTVTIAAEPTYAVTFADGTAEPDKWTAEPNTGVKKGQTVTVTYTGTKKVLGVKAEKKAAAAAYPTAANATAGDVGKLICTDGHIHAYNADAGCTKSRVAKIIYVGTTGHATYTHGLALALVDMSTKLTWDNSGANNDSKTAAEWCSAWNTSKAVTDAEWLLSSKDQWNYMQGTDGAGSYTTLRDGFESVGGSNMKKGFYWSSTEDGTDNAWNYYFGTGGEWYSSSKNYSNYNVRACLAF